MADDFKIFFKWIIISTTVGVIVGLIAVLFHFSIDKAIDFRLANPWVIFLLPVGGIVIAWLYRVTGEEKDSGTNMVITTIRSDENMKLITTPLIFISTVITHFVGGSAGKEGAALQLGSSISNEIGRRIHLDEKDMHTMSMCGMSAAFSALFGTPITAAIFSMEVVSIGIMHYSALVPCVISAIVGSIIAKAFGVNPEHFVLNNIPTVDVITIVKIIVLAILCAAVSILFCTVMKKVHDGYGKYFENAYARGFVGGVIILCLTLFVGNYDYNSGGMEIVGKAIAGDAFIGAFLLKIIFTAFTIGAGFKGGEIVPTFFTGATFGNVVSGIIGVNPGFGAGIGLVAVFCGVTNCPISSLILSVELFGSEALLFFALACAVSYMISGYTSLYSAQKIVYSKTKTEFIDKKTL